MERSFFSKWPCPQVSAQDEEARPDLPQAPGEAPAGPGHPGALDPGAKWEQREHPGGLPGGGPGSTRVRGHGHGKTGGTCTWTPPVPQPGGAGWEAGHTQAPATAHADRECDRAGRGFPAKPVKRRPRAQGEGLATRADIPRRLPAPGAVQALRMHQLFWSARNAVRPASSSRWQAGGRREGLHRVTSGIGVGGGVIGAHARGRHVACAGLRVQVGACGCHPIERPVSFYGASLSLHVWHAHPQASPRSGSHPRGSDCPAHRCACARAHARTHTQGAPCSSRKPAGSLSRTPWNNHETVALKNNVFSKRGWHTRAAAAAK